MWEIAKNNLGECSNQTMLNQVKSRKRPLRINIRQSLAKQQLEEQLRKGSLDTERQTGSQVDHSIIPVPALEISALEDDCKLEDSVFQYANSLPVEEVQLYAVPVSHPADIQWSHSAPEALMPNELSCVRKSEFDEQLDDIVSSIEKDLGTLHSTSSYICVEPATESSYRGGRRKEPPPSDMSDESRVIWEQERRRKDAHNDIEKRRREKIKDHIEELRSLVPGSYDIADQPNSTSEILEATLGYLEQLKNNVKQLDEVKARVEQLEKTQRRLLLQKQFLENAVGVAYSVTPGSHVLPVDFQTVGATIVICPAADSAMDCSSVVNDVLLNDCSDTMNCDASVSDVFM